MPDQRVRLLLLLHLLWWLGVMQQCWFSLAQKKCYNDLVVDMVFVLDLTSSMADDIVTLQQQIPKLMESVAEKNVTGRFGLVTFACKDTWSPIPGLSGCIDYVPGTQIENKCPAVKVPLTHDIKTIKDQLDSVHPEGGCYYGAHEGLSAMMLAASNQKDMKWRKKKNLKKFNQPHYVKLVVLLTDDKTELPDNPLLCSGTLNQLDPFSSIDNYACEKMRYPTVEDAHKVFKKTSVVPLFLVTRDVLNFYDEKYKDVTVENGIAELTSDSSNIVELILSFLKEIDCPTTTTTTISTTTEFITTFLETTTAPPHSPPYPFAIAGGVAAAALLGASVYVATRLLKHSPKMIDAHFDAEEPDTVDDDKNQVVAVTADNFA